jgi:rhomboid family GlyGly-CTERM serine protease
LTGHFTHWSDEHLAWDLLVFFVLGLMYEARGRSRYVTLLFAASIVIALGVWTLVPDLQTYRGLSGIDTALFTSIAFTLLQAAYREQRRGTVMLVAALLVCLGGKITFEMFTAQGVFVDASIAGFQPLPLAHLLGAAVGMALGLTGRSTTATPKP